jgi:hypothetical protein
MHTFIPTYVQYNYTYIHTNIKARAHRSQQNRQDIAATHLESFGFFHGVADIVGPFFLETAIR